MSEYMMLFDENGAPYVSHSVFSRAANKAHQYIAKVKDGLKTRYFYTKSELDAYYGNKQTRSVPPVSTSGSRPVSNRPFGRQKTVTSGNGKGVYRRGEGLNQDRGTDPQFENTVYQMSAKKRKELGEAVDSVNKLNAQRQNTRGYAKEALETFKSVLTGNSPEMIDDEGYTYYYSGIDRGYYLGLSAKAAKGAISSFAKQLKLSGKALKEIGDFAFEVAKDRANELIDKVKKEPWGSKR